MKPPKEGSALQEIVSAKLSELIMIHKHQLLECLATADTDTVLRSSIHEAAGEMLELELQNAWLKRRLKSKGRWPYAVQ